jgi:hypothetical protein
MATDAEIRAMLQSRSAPIGTEGLLDGARLVALAAGRSPLERLGLRATPVFAFMSLLIAAVAIGGFVLALRVPPYPSTSSQHPIATSHTPGLTSATPTSETPSRSGAPTVTCQVDAATCEKVVAMARALDPAPFGGDARVVVGPECGPNQFCAFGFRAVVIATRAGWLHRSELHLFEVSGTSGPETAIKAGPHTIVPMHLVGLLPPSAVPGPSSPASWLVREVLDRALPPEPVELLISGWLSATPELPCLVGQLPSGAPDFRCGEQDWLTDQKFQPWSNRRAREPKVGIRVPNGSYERFSNDPGEINGVLQPSPGTWLVRISTGSSCLFQSGLRSCSGHPVMIVEILERIS